MSSLSPVITPQPFPTFQGSIGATKAKNWYSSSNTKNSSSQTELYGDIKTGDVAHKLMFGYEYAQTKYNFANATMLYFNPSSWTVNLNAPQYQAQPSLSSYNYQFGWQNNQKSNAVYFQDQIAWGGFRLLAGIRNERVNSLGYNPETVTQSSQTEAATTGRAGILYMITPATSVYYNISQSFTPNGGYPGVNNSTLASSRGLQNEVGVKHSLRTGLDATVSLYDISKTNTPACAVTNGDGQCTAYSATGGEQSKGWEASLIGQATKSLRMIANASGINATTTQQSRNFATATTAPAGSQLAGVPKFSANIWGVQDLPLNIPGKPSIGLGVVYVGDRVATTPNVNGLILPAYTTVDMGLFYKIDRVDLALNIKNLTNSTVINSVQGMYVARQPGTSYLATAGITF